MAQRVRRRDHEEEHENEERWLLTYADMITLLMVLFIVLFSIGQVDLKKFEELKQGLTAAFGERGAAAVEGGAGVLDGGTAVLDAQAALDILEAQQAGEEAQQRALEQTQEAVAEALAGKGLGDEVSFRLENRGLTLQIVTDRVLFELGKADLRPDGKAVLDGIADAIKGIPNKIAVEGHTDNRPISGFPFASNWELSAYRATTVLRYLVEEKGFDRRKVSAAGYGEERPIVPNDSPANQAKNRRVEIVILAEPVKVDVPDLSTQFETTRTTAGTDAGEH